MTLPSNPNIVNERSDLNPVSLYARSKIEAERAVFAVGSLYGYGVNGQLYGSPVQIDSGSPSLITVTHSVTKDELVLREVKTGEESTYIRPKE